MTGFGQSQSYTTWGNIVCEIKTVNNRFLEIKIRLPQALSATEADIRSFIAKNISRGSVFVNVYFAENRAGKNSVEWNRNAAQRYMTILKNIKKEYQLSGDITVDTFIAFPDIFSTNAAVAEQKVAWNSIKKSLAEAVNKVQKMRDAEGKKLCKDIQNHIGRCSVALGKIERRLPKRMREYQTKLKKQIEKLAGTIDVNNVRFATEIAIMSERLDISEECERFYSHIDQFRKSLEGKGAVGKRLNFLLQEMNREANTIGSKANDIEIVNQSIFLKEKIEIVREQIQNIE